MFGLRVAQVFGVLQPQPPRLLQLPPLRQRGLAALAAAHLVDRFAHLRDHVKRIENNRGLRADLRRSGLVGRAHVHARLLDLRGVGAVHRKLLGKPLPSLLLPPRSGEEHLPLGQIRKDPARHAAPFARAPFSPPPPPPTPATPGCGRAPGGAPPPRPPPPPPPAFPPAAPQSGAVWAAFLC